MQDYLPYIVIGLASGSIYGIAAMGLVLTYKTSGIFNFAHGAVGMVSTFAFYSLRVDAGLPTAVAAGVAVFGVGPALGVFIDRVLFRRLRGATVSTYVVVSLGLLIVLQGLAIIRWGGANRTDVPAIFPSSTFRFADVNVGIDQAAVVALAAGASLVLALFFKFSQLGVQTRAVVDNPSLTELVGVDSARITTLSWIAGSIFASVSGLLIAPFIGVGAVLLTLLVIQAFGAAAVGRLTSLPRTYVGALLIGVAASVSMKFIATRPALAGLPTSLPFIVLFVVLVFSRKGSFPELLSSTERTPAHKMRSSRAVPWGTLATMIITSVVLSVILNEYRLLTATATLAFVLIFSSLSLLVGLSRQVSLSHAVFAALGATTLAHLQGAGVPYLSALLLAGLILTPVGALVAIPAIRLSGLFLALATFGFGILTQQLVFGTGLAFTGRGVVSIDRPELFGVSFQSERAFFLFVMVVVVFGVSAVEMVKATRLGRVLRALADSPVAVQSLGINPTSARVLVFCLSAFLAAIAGGLVGTLVSSVTPATFDFSQSLVWVAVLVASGVATLPGSILAAVLLVAVPAVVSSPTVTQWQPVAFGTAAIVFAQAPNGLVGSLRVPDFSKLAGASAWRRGSPRHQERVGDRVREVVPAS